MKENQQKKQILEDAEREQKLLQMTKWDIFREQRQEYIEFSANLLKKRNFVKRWIVLIQLRGLHSGLFDKFKK